MRITRFFNHETLMNQITQLRQVLQPHLAWHGARLASVSLFLIALFRVKRVNLIEVLSQKLREIISKLMFNNYISITTSFLLIMQERSRFN